MKRGVLRALTLLIAIFCVEFCLAQSTSQDFPTPLATNEIVGSIKPRDIGDSRLTTYFYTFNSDQGDVFVNIVTRNFTGDLDLFTVSGLRSVTKIVIYAADSENETGRAVYFRKPEKLLLRIQGRSPNDDPASFRIKFAGSFVAAKRLDVMPEPEVPKVTAANASGVRVNSVGTILPPPKQVPAKSDEIEAAVEAPKKVEQNADPLAAEVPPKAEIEKPSSGLEVVVTDPTPKVEDVAVVKRTPARRTPALRPNRPPAKVAAAKPSPEAVNEPRELGSPPVAKTTPKRAAKKSKVVKEPLPDPLASIRLVIALKDGNVVEKTMNEVFKFSVDKGILTVILKNGSVSRYPIADVAKVTIE